MDAKRDLFMVIALFVGVFFLWVYLGGPDRELSRGGAFLTPSNTVGGGVSSRGSFVTGGGQFTFTPDVPTSDTTNDTDESGTDRRFRALREQLARLQYQGIPSPHAALVSIDRHNGEANEASKEYVRIAVSDDAAAPITITGWQLKSIRTGARETIGGGTDLYRSNRVNPKDPITLAPDSEAYIVTGASPIGVSFRLNRCSGYLEQFQDFTPNLSQTCPAPEDVLRQTRNTYDVSPACIEYVEDIRSCTMPVQTPTYLPNDCRAFVREEINYNACIDRYRGTADFQRGEWRVYLGQREDLYSNSHEAILLLDAQDRVVDIREYE